MNKELLKEAIAFARANGLTSIEIEGIKMEVGPEPVSLEPSGPDIVQPHTPWDNLSDEEIMYWGTPYFEELQEKKELREKSRLEQEQIDG